MNNSNALPPEVEATLRQLLQFGFGALAVNGVIDASLSQFFVGAALSTITLGWAIWRARKSKKAIAAATTVATEAISSPVIVSPENASAVVAQKIEAVLKNGKH